MDPWNWFFLVLQAVQPDDVVEPGPRTGIVLQDAPGLLLINCQLYTQRVYVRLDPSDVYNKHAIVPKELPSDRRYMNSQTQTTLEHAHLRTVAEIHSNWGGTRWDKVPEVIPRGLLTAVSEIGSPFSIGLSAANSVSLSTIKKQMSELREEMPEIQQTVHPTAAVAGH